MNQSEIIKESLREELIQFDIYFRQSVQNGNSRIMDIIEHVAVAPGKRLRPIIVLLCAKLCGTVNEATLHAAVTVELLHTATLIHDDVVDEAPLRRGHPSVNAIYDNKRAVLSGDYFLSSALRESVKTSSLEVTSIIASLGQSLAEGELNQYAIANEIIIDENEYFKVIDKKTASLMRACAQIGAVTVNADPQTVENLGILGQKMGICFQIRDDIFDYYSNDVGKPTGNDIREGKITLPLLFALRTAPREMAEKMEEIIRARDYSRQNIDMLLDFAKQNGGIDYAYNKIEEYIAQSEYIVKQLPYAEDQKQMLYMLLDYLRVRQL